MSLLLDARSGSQQPRVRSVPDSVSSTGEEAIELCRMAGLELDPWQELVLASSLGERKDGKWAAFEIGLVVPRQNGKGAILEARELTGLFLLGERLIIHSAHQFDTSLEAYRRLWFLIESNPDFERRVLKRSNSHGEEGIELRGGQRIRFRTRTKGGGRGFSSDCLILDEAMFLPESAHAALLPTLSARPNPQVWYTGSAVDQTIHVDGVVLSRVRARGHRGDDPKLAFFEWGLERESPNDISAAEARDPAKWAVANPGLGIRITEEYIETEKRSLDTRGFAVERLGVGDWPDPDGPLASLIGIEQWEALTDRKSKPAGKVAFWFDVAPDRSWSTIAAAGKREDGRWHIETVDRRRGTAWLPDRVVQLMVKHDNLGVGCDGKSPAASLIDDLKEKNIEVVVASAADHADACGQFYDDITEDNLRHLGTPELETAVRGASQRPLGDAWAWSRKTSATDISPLVAATLAVWLACHAEETPEVWAAFG